MGGPHASTVVEIMNEGRRDSIRSMELPSIQEEMEFEGSYKVPDIQIEGVQPGDPPFPGADQFEDDDDDFYFEEEKKKKKKGKMGSLMKKPEFGSMTSIYSTDSANVYGQVPVRGTIQFGMKFDFETSCFEVHVFQAK